MNKYERIPERIIDLHGKTLREAKTLLHTLCEERAVSHARIIVGKGLHSKGGAILRTFVKEYLTESGIRFEQSKIMHGGEGAVEVFLGN